MAFSHRLQVGGNQVVYFAVSFNFHTSHKTQKHTVASLQACHLYAAFHIVTHTRWALSCSRAVSGKPPTAFDANS